MTAREYSRCRFCGDQAGGCLVCTAPRPYTGGIADNGRPFAEDWQHAPARSTDPVTSHIAAEALTIARLRELQRLVYEAFLAVPDGMTDDELQDQLVAMGHGHRFRGASTASVRRGELEAGPCKACHGTGSVDDGGYPAECARCWGTGRKPGLVEPVIDDHGVSLKRPTKAGMPARVYRAIR